MPSLSKSVFLAVVVIVSVNQETVAQSETKYPANLFSVSLLHFDSVRQPHGVEFYAQTTQAKAMISTMAAAIGVHPGFVALALSRPTSRQEGEETHYVLPVETGYAYCGTRVRVTSIVPADGERASVINAAVNPREFQMTTWTPVRHLGEGRSWAEGDVQLYGIKPQYLQEFVDKGVCKRVTEQIGILSCRGRATCGAGVTHGNPLEAGPTTPNLTKGFF
jgi:hypothetical protein